MRQSIRVKRIHWKRKHPMEFRDMMDAWMFVHERYGAVELYAVPTTRGVMADEVGYT